MRLDRLSPRRASPLSDLAAGAWKRQWARPTRPVTCSGDGLGLMEGCYHSINSVLYKWQRWGVVHDIGSSGVLLSLPLRDVFMDREDVGQTQLPFEVRF